MYIRYNATVGRIIFVSSDKYSSRREARIMTSRQESSSDKYSSRREARIMAGDKYSSRREARIMTSRRKSITTTFFKFGMSRIRKCGSQSCFLISLSVATNATSLENHRLDDPEKLLLDLVAFKLIMLCSVL